MQQIQNLQLVLEALQGAAAIVDAEGEFITTNKKWKDKNSFHWFGINSNGNYFSLCEKAVKTGNDFALKLIFGLREVLDGKRACFEMSAPFTRDTAKSWFRISVSALGGDMNNALILVEDISKNMLALQDLSDSKERYTQQFIHALSGIIISTPEGEIVDANPAACNILGYSKNELISGGLELIEPEQTVQNDAPDAPHRKSVFEEEVVYIHKEGTEIFVEMSSVLYRNKNGELRSIKTFRDNTKVKEAEKNLEAERRFTSLAVNSIPGAFYVLDEKKRIIKWNRTLIEDLGYSEKEIREMSILDIISEKDQARVEKVVDDIFVSGTGHVVTEINSNEKGVRNYHLYANRFKSEGKDFIVGAGIDITGLVESEKERFKNYELLSQLFNNSPMAMVMINPRNAIQKVNDSFTTLFGYRKEEIIGENVNELIAGNEQFQKAQQLSEKAFSGQRHQEECIRYTKDGKELTVLLNTVPIISKGEVIAVYGIYVDLTEQKKLEKQNQNSLREKEVLLQEVHHRVKNNLAIMAGLLDLQIMEEEDSRLAKQLNEVRSRVFSVAKIHETLYQEKDVVSIRFDKYLKTITKALAYQNLNIRLNAYPLTLNLNQAVPFGLAINELFNLVLSDNEMSMDLDISLVSENDNVELFLEGENLDLLPLDAEMKTNSFQDKLINIFLNQMGGRLELENSNSKKVWIRFTKAEMRGSSSSLKNNSELYSRK